MRRISATILLALCALLFIGFTSAQQTSTLTTTTAASVPNLIRYSATLKDAQGAPVSPGTAVGVTFAIYNQQDGGAAVWQETQNVTPDASGNYNALLGSTTATGLPDDLFSQQEQRWLGVQVQGQEEQARVLLVSVPYAFKAHNADTLGGLPASAFVQAAPSNAPGNGSTDTGTAVNALSTAGNAGSASKAKGPNGKLPPGPCIVTPGYITYWDSTGALCPSNLFQVFNPASPYFGNIGIGTQNPSTAFDVFGAIDVSPIAKAVPTNSGNYQILENPVLSIGWPSNEAIAANQNTLVGVLAGAQGFVQNPGTGNTGTSETFVGYNAGFHNQTGSNNTALGEFAGYRNVNGNGNTSVGAAAGFGVFGETVTNTTITGFDAGYSNTGNNVSFYGYQAGFNNTANNNSFFGYQAGTANTSGSSNTFLGNMAGTATTTGNGDTFVGDSAGLANVTNNYNTFTGQNAGKANTVDANSFYGYNSGTVNTTGNQNTFFGYLTGSTNTVGGGNTFIGWKAGLNSYDPAGGDCCNTYVGNGAGAGVNGPSLAAGNSFFGHRAGEATTTGGKNAYFGYWSGLVNQTGSFNSFYGDQSGQSLTTGSYNTFLGISAAGTTFTSGNYNTFVGAFAGDQENPGVNYSIEIGNNGSNHYGNGSIQIGTMGTNVNNTYIAGFAPSTMPPNVYYSTATGQLFATTGSSGGGNVIGPNPPCTANYLTIWTGGLNVGCSAVWQNPTSPYFVGIGTAAPARQLDVNGEINTATHYEISDSVVVSIDGTNNTLLGVGPSSTGGENTIVGNLAGASNAGSNNTFVGYEAGVNNGNQGDNTFLGAFAGSLNNAGTDNTFVGYGTGNSFQAGSGNIFLGWSAGNNNGTTTASTNDIYIGNLGCPVTPCVENQTIRIGNNPFFGGAQTDTYIAGIYNSTPGGANQEVCVDATGKLWGTAGTCNTSSRRFKDQIASMGDSSSKLFQLRPVTFFYKPQYDDGSHALQYGLIAEEVAEVYPEMAVYDKEGQPSGVKYQMLAPMLLSELQKEHSVVMAQQDELQTQLQQIKAQRQEIDGLKHELQLQNASLQLKNASLEERLTKLESYVETQMKTASEGQPVVSASPSGDSQ
jgi:uncharacterized membrane protein